SIVTVMSAEPFTMWARSNGPMIAVATLTGFDAITNDDDGCTYVLEMTDTDGLSDIVANVYSPLISIFYDTPDFRDSWPSITANVGIENLDFSGISFAASPGFIGCSGGEMYRSSLYNQTTSFEYHGAYGIGFTTDSTTTDSSFDSTTTFFTSTSESTYIPSTTNYSTDSSTTDSITTDTSLYSTTPSMPSTSQMTIAPTTSDYPTDSATTDVSLYSTTTVRPSTSESTVLPSSTEFTTDSTTTDSLRPTTPTVHPKYISSSTRNRPLPTTPSRPTTSGAPHYGKLHHPDVNILNFQVRRS
ncbi:hypothetical protein PMAYCL1PPCAC_21623, partial [Pristionchus mayeri]